MTDTVRAVLEIALRFLELRIAPLHLHIRQRDGPREYPESFPHPERVTGQPGAPQQHSYEQEGFTDE